MCLNGPSGMSSGDFWIGMLNPNAHYCNSKQECAGKVTWSDGSTYVAHPWQALETRSNRGHDCHRVPSATYASDDAEGCGAGYTYATLCQFSCDIGIPKNSSLLGSLYSTNTLSLLCFQSTECGRLGQVGALALSAAVAASRSVSANATTLRQSTAAQSAPPAQAKRRNLATLKFASVSGADEYL